MIAHILHIIPFNTLSSFSKMRIWALIVIIACCQTALAQQTVEQSDTCLSIIQQTLADLEDVNDSLLFERPDSVSILDESLHIETTATPLDFGIKTIYAQPYSLTLNDPDWHRMWINTAALGSAFVGSLLVLECLPEDATTWNRAEIQKVPMFKRWFRNIFKRGPEWDHDNPIFNYVLHPYAGSAYFMSARSCGFNYYRSLLYCACISTIGWEFGIEAFMERPSYQDLFITPLVGSLIGEGCYRAKRYIVDNGYSLLGSRFIGGFAAWILDPVNEFIGLFAGNPARKLAGKYREARLQVNLQPVLSPSFQGFALTATF